MEAIEIEYFEAKIPPVEDGFLMSPQAKISLTTSKGTPFPKQSYRTSVPSCCHLGAALSHSKALAECAVAVDVFYGDSEVIGRAFIPVRELAERFGIESNCWFPLLEVRDSPPRQPPSLDFGQRVYAYMYTS
jgi:hypothetical protein